MIGVRLSAGGRTLRLCPTDISFDQVKFDWSPGLCKVNHVSWSQPAFPTGDAVANLNRPIPFRLDHPPVGNFSDSSVPRLDAFFLGNHDVAPRVTADR